MVGAMLLLIVPEVLHGQETGSVVGTVTAAGSGQPVVGAAVSVPNTGRNTVTDERGAFLLATVPAGEQVVRVESLGFRAGEEAVTVEAGGTVEIDIVLQVSAINLDQIVVTGTVGRTTRRSLGNTVSSINAAAVTEVAPVGNIQQLLQGRSAGVTLLPSSGAVGGSSRIRVRGLSSLQGNEPVVYIDGVRVFSGTSTTVDNSTSQGINRLESLNPNDIESVEIIKGPAASTLYGAEAAAGVIQIITKQGNAGGGLQWNAKMEYGLTDWAVDHTPTYWLCQDEHIDDPEDYPGCQLFTKDQPLSERRLVDYPFDMDRRSPAVYQQLEDAGLPTDRFTCLFPEQSPCNPSPLRTGNSSNINLSVRGGGESYNFYISGERSRQEGTMFNNHSHRTSARANFGFVPSERASFNVNMAYAQLDQQIPWSDNSSNSIFRNGYRGQAGGPTSQYLPGYRNFHPEFSNKLDQTQEIDRLTMSLSAQYDPFDWWQNRVTVGLDRHARNNRTFDQIDQTGLSPFGQIAATGRIQSDLPTTYVWSAEYTGTATADLGVDYSSAFSLGMQLVKRREDEYTVDGRGLVANQVNLVSAAAQTFAGQEFEEQVSLGFFAQETVGWRDRLFGTVAVRVDDNSAFGDEFSVVAYPKASLSYVISDEDYFDIPWVDDLKLRGAWGRAGNAPDPFSADRSYEALRTIVDGDAVPALQTEEFGNANLKAETGQEFEIGFDASLLQGRISTDLTYFYQQTKDALVDIDAPPSSGWSETYLANIGEIRNHGLELTVDAQTVDRPNFRWQTILSASTVSNELVSFGRDAKGNPVRDEVRFGPFIETQRHREGYPLGGFWAQDVLRDEQGNVILDDDGNASVPNCMWPAETAEDCSEVFVGPMLPTLELGLTNQFTLFDRLTLYTFLDYQGGHHKWCALCSVRTRIDQNSAEITDPNLADEERARLLSLQTAEFIYPADFVKLREVSLSYALPQQWIARTGFSRASVTLSGRNLAIWTRYKGSEDPEVSFNSTDEFQSADYASIPMQRRLSMSLNLEF